MGASSRTHDRAEPFQPGAALPAARRHLESAIRAGGLKPGDRLDSETILTGPLCESAGSHVRQAVDELVRKQTRGP